MSCIRRKFVILFFNIVSIFLILICFNLIFENYYINAQDIKGNSQTIMLNDTTIPFYLNQTSTNFKSDSVNNFSNRLYQNKTMGISFEYPNSWNITDATLSYMYIEPIKETYNKSYGENLNYLLLMSSPSQNMELLDFASYDINYLKSFQYDVNILESNKSKLGGNDAHNITYTFKDYPDSYITFQKMLIYVNTGIKYYTIEYQAEIDKYDDYLPIVKNIIKSIKFDTKNKNTNTIVKSGIILDSSPVDVAVNPTTNKIYLAIPDTDKVYVVDGFTNSIISNITINGVPNSIVVNPKTNTIYVASYETDKIYVIDGFNNTVVKSISSGPFVADMAIDSNEFSGLGSLIFIANRGNENVNSSVHIIDGITNKIIGNISIGRYSDSYGVGIDQTLNKAYITNIYSSDVSVIDYGTTLNHTFFYEYISSIPVGLSPTGITVDPYTGKIYVTNSGEDTISVIDIISTKKPIIKYKVGLFPNALAFNSNNSKLYVANSGNNTISVFDTNLNRIEKKPIQVDSVPYDVAVNPLTNLIYVANFESKTLSTINGTSNKLSAVVKFYIYPENSGKIICNGKDVSANKNIPIRLDIDTKCKAESFIDYKFKKWSEEQYLDNPNKTKAEFTEPLISLYNSVYRLINPSSEKQNISTDEKNITKHGIILAEFSHVPSLITSIQLAGPSLSLIVLVISIIIVCIFPDYSKRKLADIKQQDRLSRIDILGIDGAIIAGVLIFLSLTEGFDITEQTQITIITANIVFPFAISAILAILNHEKYATRFMIGGFINLILSVILIAIMKL
jgi:YVTN family beta-propeller protein